MPVTEAFEGVLLGVLEGVRLGAFVGPALDTGLGVPSPGGTGAAVTPGVPKTSPLGASPIGSLVNSVELAFGQPRGGSPPLAAHSSHFLVGAQRCAPAE